MQLARFLLENVLAVPRGRALHAADAVAPSNGLNDPNGHFTHMPPSSNFPAEHEVDCERGT